MTEPKEKPKAAIKTRTPGRLGGSGMFDRVHLRAEPHPIQEIIAGGAQTEEESAAGIDAMPPTPVATPVITPVATPAETPVATPVTPVETTVPEVRREREPLLDATHTASEKSVYSIMYRETISKGGRERHFGFKELSQKTGIRSDATIRRALDGLLAKLSVEIVAYQHGNPLGPRYRVYEPKEIVRRRREAGIEIDPQSKRIATPVATGVVTGVATGVSTPVATGGKNDGSTPAKPTPVTPATSTGASLLNDLNPNLPAMLATKSASSNLNAQADDEDLTIFNQIIRTRVRQIVGRPIKGEGQRWAQLATTLMNIIERAAARTEAVSSAPAFATAVLLSLSAASERRRRPQTRRPDTSVAGATALPAVPAQPLSDELRREQLAFLTELLNTNYGTLEQIEEQFARTFEPDEWQLMRRELEASLSPPANTPAELNPAQVQEQIELLTNLRRDGVMLSDLETQFAANFRPDQWAQIVAGVHQLTGNLEP